MILMDSQGQIVRTKPVAVYSNDPEWRDGFCVPDKAFCEFCGKERPFMGSKTGDAVCWFPHPQPCGCDGACAAAERYREEADAKLRAQAEADRAERQRNKIKRLFAESGMNARFAQRTFQTLQVTPQNRLNVTAAKRYADGFVDKLPTPGSDPGRNGMLFIGPPGTGKTHIAAAIANQLMAGGTPVICMTMIDLLERIRRTFRTADGGDESEILSAYKKVPLLVIDDIGKEKPTDWAIATIYSIVNGRYESCMPTIITTNYDPATLVRRLTPKDTGDSMTAEATLDRLMEMCAVVPMVGESWRRNREVAR